MAVSSVRGPGAAQAPGPGRAPGAAALPVAAPARAATAVSIGAALLVVAVQVAVPGGWGALAWVPLVVGLLLGLPHGAVDHLVPGFVLRDRAPHLLLVALGYAGVAAVAWVCLRWQPIVALVVFVGLSVVHFGLGEVAFDQVRGGRRLHPDPLAAFAAGGAVLLLPLTTAPDALAPLIAVLAPGTTGLLPRWLTAGLTALVLLAVAVSVLRNLRRRAPLPAAELLLLTAVGLVVPPLAAFGAYFGGWHAVRHVGRLLADDPRNEQDLRAGRIRRPLRRFLVSASVPTLLSLVALLGLWAAAGGWRGFVTTDLALLAGLTLPHALMVAWRDQHPTS